MTPDQALSSIQFSNGVIAVDTETTGLNVKDGRDYLMGISIAWRDSLGLQAHYFPFRHRFGDNLDKRYLTDIELLLKNKASVFHNAKFDLQSLKTIDLSAVGKFYDTQIMAHMVNEEWFSKELNWLGTTLLKESKTDDVAKYAKVFGYGNVPVELMAPYACQDTRITLQLYELFRKEFDFQELGPLWQYEESFVRMLNEMESRGILIDQQLCSTLVDRSISNLERLQSELGFDPGKPSQLSNFLFSELNLPILKISPKTGKPTLDKEVMQDYDLMLNTSNNPTAQQVLAFRGWKKALTSYYEPYLELLSPDGRLRPNYRITGTRTGRLSCSDPNLQQVPKRTEKAWSKEVKSCMVARPGYSLVEFDYANLEMRIAAVYADVKEMIDDFDNGTGDAHSVTARLIFGEVTPESRHTSKQGNFCVLYAGGPRKLSTTLGVELTVAQEFFKRFNTTMPGFQRATTRASDLAERRGYVKYWTGRRRHFTDGQRLYKAFNSIIQGGAAELVKRAMLKINNEITVEGQVMPLLQVHDSCVMEVRDDLVQDVIPAVTKVMENAAPEIPIKFKVDSSLWGSK